MKRKRQIGYDLTLTFMAWAVENGIIEGTDGGDAHVILLDHYEESLKGPVQIGLIFCVQHNQRLLHHHQTGNSIGTGVTAGESYPPTEVFATGQVLTRGPNFPCVNNENPVKMKYQQAALSEPVTALSEQVTALSEQVCHLVAHK